jgi:hypothetical protein
VGSEILFFHNPIFLSFLIFTARKPIDFFKDFFFYNTSMYTRMVLCGNAGVAAVAAVVTTVAAVVATVIAVVATEAAVVATVAAVPVAVAAVIATVAAVVATV